MRPGPGGPGRGPGRGGPGGRFAMPVEKPKNAGATLKRLVKYFKKELNMVIALVLVVVMVVCLSIVAPKLQSEAIDSITIGEFGRLPSILGVMLGAYLISAGFTWGQTILSARLSQKIVRHMREELFDKIMKLPIKYLDRHPHGDVMSRMTNDIENISNTVSQSLGSLVSGLLTIIGTVTMMVSLCWQLALISCITVVLTVVTTKILSKKMRIFYRRQQRLLGTLNSTVEEMVTGYKTVVAYNHQDIVYEDFARTSEEYKKVGIKAEVLGGSMGPIMNLINNIGFVIIAAFGGYFAINGIISVGIISAFIIYAKQFGRPINEIAQLYGQIQTAIAGSERVFAILDETEEDKGGSGNMENAEGIISFKNVNFGYTPEKQVIFDFNLDIKNGQKIALVGATGSGKTTIVNLLMRFYDVDSGEILIDGVNVRDIDCDELRRHTAMVLQDTVLFSDTVRNNLKYSNINASDEEMVEAAKLSNCHGMITKLKNGYDTQLVEAGQNLSQGQRQLLTIGRAFLANPTILILDEATSSVDTRTEKNIQNAMVNLMKNRTSIIIAHRLSTIQDADVIVVMDKGRIVETGCHDELIAKKGRYYELYMTQFAGNEI
ncbi:MAG: ABC transporter ATP-binding protein [Oscillospiraceae bacterium]|nr:ABC transporter ATP-binding protein [Oscillospiraceae bacterium]MBQ9938761.1 ABC transporter ATP-binding protein [Oscillospiraceae bacterium]